MHPHTFYSSLFDLDRRDEVFVAMSFAHEFDARWFNVIEPTIREDLGLTANRVDYNVSGESIVHDILDGIAHSKLVIADITSIQMTDPQGQQWPQRNANVLWELGIAHTMRLPDEVILIKSDSDSSIFDLTQFRAFQYDPSDIKSSRSMLRSLAQDRLSSIDYTKSDFVHQCADGLDPHSIEYLITQVPIDGTHFHIPLNLMNAAAVPRLFENGILKAANYHLGETDEAGEKKPRLDIKYAITSLGLAVANLLASRIA